MRRPYLTALLVSSALATPELATAQTAGASAPDEIVVTARKRDETLQEVPTTVSVVSDDAIDQLSLQSLSDITKTSAGILFDNEFGRTSNRPVIRGQANILGDSGVAYFIDGVYVTGSLADYDVQDIERVEIVKGPQSALYGRNTYSGAINILTQSPAGDLSGQVRADVSEYDRYEVTGSVGGSITDTLSGRIGARYYSFGGEFTNAFDGEKIGDEETMSVSGVLEWAPSDRLTVRARGYYAESEDGQSALFLQSADQNNCFEDNGTLYGGLGRYYCGVVAPGQVNVNAEEQFDGQVGRQIDTTQLSLRADWDVGERGTFTSITGFNDRGVVDRTDGDYAPTSFQTAVFTPGGFPFAGFPVPPFSYAFVGTTVDFSFENDTQTRDFSQELRFLHDGDRVDLLAGVYYFDQDTDSQDIRDLPDDAAARAGASFGAAFGQQQALCAANPICGSIVPFFGPSVAESRDRSEEEVQNTAVFGSIGFDVTDTLTVSVEGRYQEERIRRLNIDPEADTSQGLFVRTPGFAVFESFTPRVLVDWSATEDNLLYGIYAQGTKPGGFNSVLAASVGVPTFDEEKVANSFEIGSKNTLADGQATLNLAAFFNELEGYQISRNVFDEATGRSQSATTNAGDAEVFGVEVEGTLRPAAVEGLTIFGNYAYTDAEFTSGTDENQGLLNDVADDGLVNCSLGDEFSDTDCQSAFGSIAGNRIPRTAEHVAFVDAEYRFDAPGLSGWDAFVGANFRYESSKFAQVVNEAETGDTELLNARAGIVGDRVAVRFYVNNILDEDSTPLVLRYADAEDSFKRAFVGSRRRGRHAGVNVTLGF